MVFSLLPVSTMNVFGQPVGTAGTATQVLSRSRIGFTNVELYVNYAAFAGWRADELTLIVTVGGNGNNMIVPDAAFSTDTIGGNTVRTITPRGENLEDVANAGQIRNLNITGDATIPGGWPTWENSDWVAPTPTTRGALNWQIDAVGNWTQVNGINPNAEERYALGDLLTGDVPPFSVRGARQVEISLVHPEGDQSYVLPRIADLAIGADRVMRLDLDMYLYYPNATVSVALHRNGIFHGWLIQNQNLVQAPTGDALNITLYGSPRAFTNDLLVPQIRIEEMRSRVFGTVAGRDFGFRSAYTAVQFVAPAGYTWFDGGQIGTVGGGFYVSTRNGTFTAEGNSAISPGTSIAGAGNTRQYWITRGTGNNIVRDRHVIVVFVPNSRAAGVQPDQLRFNNLWLRPIDADRVATGNVNIEVRVGGASSIPGNIPNVSGNPYGRPNINFPGWLRGYAGSPSESGAGYYPGAPFAFNPSGRDNTNLTVGVRGVNGLLFRAMPGDDGLPELRTGLWYTQGGGLDRSYVTTARVLLSEEIQGSWESTSFNGTEFYFGEGIQILGVRIRASRTIDRADWHGDDRIISDTTFFLSAGDLGIRNEDLSGNDFGSPNPWNYSGGRARLTPSNLQIFLPLSGNANRLHLYHMDVEFYLSVRAGYEHLISDEIEVGIRGAAIQNNLPAADRSAVVAYARDPITVTRVGPVVEANVATAVHTPAQAAPISDILISETEVGALRRGELIRVEAVALPFGIVGTSNLRNSVVTADTATSGMEIRVTPDAHNGFVIEITRESHGNTPGTITIANNTFMSVIIPGVEYLVSVATPMDRIGVAENTRLVGTDQGQGFGGAEVSRLGDFNALAYYVEVITAGDFTVPAPGQPGIPGLPGVPGAVIPQLPNLVLQDGMGPVATNVLNINGIREAITVTQPMRTVGFPGTTMIAMRVFANHIDGTLNWNPTDRIATIQGIHHGTGEQVTVSAQIGNNLATIQTGLGHVQTVDIATFVNFQSGAAQTVAPVILDNLTYLPARFFAYAFGLDVQWAAGVTTISMPN